MKISITLWKNKKLILKSKISSPIFQNGNYYCFLFFIFWRILFCCRFQWFYTNHHLTLRLCHKYSVSNHHFTLIFFNIRNTHTNTNQIDLEWKFGKKQSNSINNIQNSISFSIFVFDSNIFNNIEFKSMYNVKWNKFRYFRCIQWSNRIYDNNINVIA